MFKGDPLGPFSLRIREETGLKLGPKGFTKAGSLRPTDTIDPIMNAPAQTFNFILKKGTPCIVAMNSKDFEPYVRVENMAGINVKYEDLGGEGKSSLTYPPLADGIYRIVATSYDYKTGPFDLKVTEGQPAKQYEVGPQGLKYTSSLSKTDPFDIEFGKPTQFRCQILEVKMKAKQKYQCDLTSNQFDPILRIEDLRGKELAFDKNSGGLRHCRIVFSPAADGIFRVIVSQDSFRLGAFDLSVRPLLPEKGADAWFKQGMAQAKLGKWDQAILDLSKAIELAPNADAAWNERGIAYFRQGKWEKANADFARAADLNPANPIYWSNRGDSFGKLGQHGKAIKDFSRAIDLKPDFTTPWHLRGSARAFLGEWEQAAEDLAKASSFPTATPQACSDLALVRLQLKDSKGYREACARFQDKWTQNRNPQVAVQLAWTAGAVADSGVDFAPVVEALEKNKGKAMMEYAYLRALGAALYRAGKSEEAIKKLQEAANSRKQPTPSVWIFLAMAHHQLGQEDDAQKWLKKAGTWLEEARQKDAEPGAPGPVWWKNLPWTERITLDFTFREAQELLKKPSKSDP